MGLCVARRVGETVRIRSAGRRRIGRTLVKAMSGPGVLLADIDTTGVRGRLTPGADMSAVTWFRVGGPADLLFQPADEDDLALFLAGLDPAVPVTVVGIGSNLLVRDGGIEGVVVRLAAKGFGGAELLDGNRLRVGAALPDKRLAAFALEQGLDGFAF